LGTEIFRQANKYLLRKKSSGYAQKMNKLKTNYMLILFLAGCLISYILMNLHSIPHSLDTRFYYSLGEGMKFLNGLSLTEIQNYLITEIADLFFIINYTGLMFIIGRKMKIYFLLAFLPGIFDLIETTSIILFLTGSFSSSQINGLGVVTLLKWLCAALFNLLLIYKITLPILRSKR